MKQEKVKLIPGAGTTGERSNYTWTDTGAKPNTVYYYQIEDVSHAGVRKQLATVRLRGLVCKWQTYDQLGKSESTRIISNNRGMCQFKKTVGHFIDTRHPLKARKNRYQNAIK